MNSSISWVGNRVLDPNTGSSRPAARSPGSAPSATRRDTTAATPATSGGQTGETPAGRAESRQQGSDVSMAISEGPPPVAEKGYIPYYLASNIGQNVRAEFIIGTNQYFDKVGVIHAVGINYFVLHDICSDNYVMCDLYSVKFVTILPSLKDRF
ncbi:MAG TPA: hypothetical protein PK597_04780 [Oscillospiraceae bacterium]|nr:hypothetical protein [Oscillospiraceae bacterium]